MNWEAPKGSRNSLNPVAPLEHVNCFRATSLTRMASIAGLREIRMPLTLQYGYMARWRRPAGLVRDIIGPMVRAVSNRSGALTKLFRLSSATCSGSVP